MAKDKMGIKMNNDFDLETFVDLFDTAMSSDNPTVRKAFKNLMMVAALVESENQDPKIRPLRELVKTVEALKEKVHTLESQQYAYKGGNTIFGPSLTNTTPYSTNTPTWIAPTYTYTTANGSAGGNGGSSNLSYTIDQAKIDSILKGLETK